MKRRWSVVMAPGDAPAIVSDAQLRMLQFVRKHPGAFYGEVAAHIGFDRPSVTAYASRMERVGLVKRKHVQDEGRTYAVLFLANGVRLDLNVRRV